MEAAIRAASPGSGRPALSNPITTKIAKYPY
jgi:hypothetical protein